MPRPQLITTFVLLVTLSQLPTPASASLIITIDQVGPDVVATGSGSLNTAELQFVGNISQTAEMFPSFANQSGPPDHSRSVHRLHNSPTKFRLRWSHPSKLGQRLRIRCLQYPP